MGTPGAIMRNPDGSVARDPATGDVKRFNADGECPVCGCPATAVCCIVPDPACDGFDLVPKWFRLNGIGINLDMTGGDGYFYSGGGGSGFLGGTDGIQYYDDACVFTTGVNFPILVPFNIFSPDYYVDPDTSEVTGSVTSELIPATVVIWRDGDTWYRAAYFADARLRAIVSFQQADGAPFSCHNDSSPYFGSNECVGGGGAFTDPTGFLPGDLTDQYTSGEVSFLDPCSGPESCRFRQLDVVLSGTGHDGTYRLHGYNVDYRTYVLSDGSICIVVVLLIDAVVSVTVRAPQSGCYPDNPCCAGTAYFTAGGGALGAALPATFGSGTATVTDAT